MRRGHNLQEVDILILTLFLFGKLGIKENAPTIENTLDLQLEVHQQQIFHQLYNLLSK